MKYRNIAMAVLLVLTSCVRDRISPAFDGPAPIAVLIEENPWLWVVGSDVPSVVLYADGLLVYRDVTITNDLPFRSFRLPERELRTLCESVDPSEAFSKLHPNLVLVDGFDLPSTKMYLSNGRAHKMVSVYGSLIENGHLKACSSDTNIAAPNEFVRVQTLLSSLSNPDARPWVPEYFEIIIWPYDYAPNQRDWPASFPGLQDRLTVRRKKGAYSLFMKGSRKAELMEYLSKSAENEAILIDGKKWAHSVRPVFPSEPVWRAAEKECEDVLPKHSGM